MKPVRIVIMAKAPLPGYAKTRLIPALGEEGAACLARQMLDHAVGTALQADIGPVECCVTPDPLHPVWTRLKNHSISWTSQVEGDLGLRMEAVARRVIADGESLLLIGTDCPGLQPRHLQIAAQWLAHGQACMIPVTDGGYCLLGLNHFHASVFTDIPWSSSRVAEYTRYRISRLQWSLAEFEQLQDIDEPEDLNALPPAMRNKLTLNTF